MAERIKDEKKSADIWMGQAGNIVEHQINKTAEFLKSVTGQIITEELYGKKMTEYNKNKKEEYLQTNTRCRKEKNAWLHSIRLLSSIRCPNIRDIRCRGVLAQRAGKTGWKISFVLSG